METNTEKRTEELVDQLLKVIFDQATPEIKTLVTHKFPDDDAWLCLWIAKKFIQKAANAQIVFVNAGETLFGTEGNPSVIHFDTGNGQYDQHQKSDRKRTCSSALLVEKLGLDEEEVAGLRPLLEMATAVDNIKKLPETSLHFLIEGYPRLFNNNGNVDWQRVHERVFDNFEIVYGQEKQRVESRKNLDKFAERTILANGLKVTTILWHPGLREAAFEEGAAAVIWTISKNGGKRFYTGIQANRDYPELRLTNVVLALRSIEAKAHGISEEKAGNVWFLLGNQKFIANGTRTHQPADDEYTKLVPRQIVGIVHRALSAIPREKVSQWKVK